MTRPSAPAEPPGDHLGLLRDPETPVTPEERASLARIRERLIERVPAQTAVELLDPGTPVDPEESQS